MGTSAAKIKEEFFTDLGAGEGGLVTVELSDAAFSNALKASKRWFTAKKGYQIFRPIPAVSGQTEYKMKDDVAQVLDVIFEVPSDVSAFFTLGFFDIIPWGPNTLLSFNSGLGNYSGFVQLLQFNETRKKVFSVDPDWYYDQQNKSLKVTQRQNTLSPGGIMLVQCKLNDFDPATLSDKDDYIFVRYVKAKCKDIVGRARSKYDSLPGAGGPVTLDGQRLIEEAKEEMEKLEIEIFASAGPDIPLVG